MSEPSLLIVDVHQDRSCQLIYQNNPGIVKAVREWRARYRREQSKSPARRRGIPTLSQRLINLGFGPPLTVRCV